MVDGHSVSVSAPSGLTIGGVAIGPGQPCRVCAEISNAHGGDLQRCLRIMRGAKDAGADLLKCQAFTVDELCALRGEGSAPEPWGAQGYTMRTLYERALTPLAWLPTLFAYARELGLPLFASVFGPDSLAAVLDCDCPALKIAHLDARDEHLAALVLQTHLPILVSVSAPHMLADLYDDHVAQLYCPGSYPAALSELKFDDVTFGEGGFLGFSCHTRSPVAVVAAVARGAKLIETHVQRRDEPSMLEANLSLDEQELAARITLIRETEQVL